MKRTPLKIYKALFFHCTSHKLNLVVNDLNCVPEIRNTITTVKDVINFFREFAIRRKWAPTQYYQGSTVISSCRQYYCSGHWDRITTSKDSRNTYYPQFKSSSINLCQILEKVTVYPILGFFNTFTTAAIFRRELLLLSLLVLFIITAALLCNVGYDSRRFKKEAKCFLSIIIQRIFQ